MNQDFSSTVHQAAFTAIPRLTERYHLLTLPLVWSTSWNSKTITEGIIQDQDSICFISFTNFSSMFLLTGWLIYEILNGPLFWAHYTPKQNQFWKIARYFTTPTWSVPPLFDHIVQVFISADKGEHLAQCFKRTHDLNLNVSTANHSSMVNRTINDFFHRPHPHLTEAQLTNPYELQCLIHSLNTKSAPGTDGISTTMLRNFSHMALIHLTQLFNHILRFGYFPSTWNLERLSPF